MGPRSNTKGASGKHNGLPYDWDQYARRAKKGRFQDRIALHKKNVHLELIRDWAASLEGKIVLKTDANEEAFGADAFLNELSATAAVAVGMDVSAEIVVRAKRRFPNLPYAAANVKNLPFLSSVFDIIISNSTLDHLPREEVPEAVRELGRILKPGAILILTLDNKHNPLHVFSHWIRRFFGWFYTDRCYSVPETTRLLRENGFQVLAATAVFHIPFPLNFLAKTAERFFGSGMNALIEGIIRICGGLDRFPTRYLTGRHIAFKARKPGEDPSRD